MKKKTSSPDGNDNGDDPWRIRAWAPITTRLLRQSPANSSSWHVLDNVMSNDSFVSQARQELAAAGVLDRLTAARTHSDGQASHQILSLLAASTMGEQPTQHLGVTLSLPPSVRGDRSTFLGRDVRKQERFVQQCPYIARLVDSVERTAHYYLEDTLELDFSLTSVQIAEFPGDGVSSYPRHCDRNGNQCRREDDPPTRVNGDNTKNFTRGPSAERLLTSVYYLTPDDWDFQLDGGCLRLYQSNDDDSSYHDVAPYSNRLVIFRSDAVEHQVLPSFRRCRLALTIWLYGQEKAAGSNSFHKFDALQAQLQQQSAAQQKSLASPPLKATISINTATQTGPPPLPLLDDAMMTSKGLCPVTARHALVFVSIAAYRDSETGPTIRDLFAMASHPERIVVGLVLQLDTDKDQRILSDIAQSCPADQVRTIHLDARHALGPCYARALTQTLLRGEEYILQIDSHMRFRQHWDTYLIQQCDLLCRNDKNNTKVMLTTYPVGYQLPNRIPNETRGTLLVPWKFDDNRLLRQRGRLFAQNQRRIQPVPCHLYAAGFNFGRASVVQDCPYDGSLHHLFFGEELSMAVRLFTHGYDLYAPTETVCYHLWSRDHRPTHCIVDNKDHQRTPHANANATIRPQNSSSSWHVQRKQRSIEIVERQVLGTSSYGLGIERTPQPFAAKLGVDFGQQTISDLAALGGLDPNDIGHDGITTILCPESMEGKVLTLDVKAQNLIASFLNQLST